MYGMRQMAASNRKRGDFLLEAWDISCFGLGLEAYDTELIRDENDMRFLTDLRVLKKRVDMI